MRLFIAVSFSPSALDAICCIRDALKLEKASYTRRDNMHLTLSFLGECSGKEMKNACTAMEALDYKPFSICMDHIGSFHRGDGDIIWLGAEKSDMLLSLQKDLAGNLSERGFNLEKGKFRPHVTLARRAFPPFHGKAGVNPIVQEVSSISLMLSERVDGHMEYTPLHVKSFF